VLKLKYIGLPFPRVQRLSRPKGYWSNKQNRREFLCQLAQEQGFDPYVPENWTKVKTKYVVKKVCVFIFIQLTLDSSKKANRLIALYGSLAATVQASFPELSWAGT